MIVRQDGEALAPPPDYFIVPTGYASMLDQPNVIEVDTRYPIAMQFFPAPYEANLVPLAPFNLDENGKVKDGPEDISKQSAFLQSVYQAILCYRISQQAQGAFGPMWIHNTLTNFEAFKEATPVCKLKRHPEKDFALICGNGSSFHEQIKDIPSNAEIFAVWRVVKPLMDAGITPDYACHIDHMHLDGWAEELPCPAIATPYADPAFVEMAKHGLYGYYELGKTWTEWFAARDGVALHRPIEVSVSYQAVMAAIYAGHKNIVLLGVDYAWPAETDYDGLNKFAMDFTNRHGVKLKTELAFLTGAGAIGMLAKQYGVKIWQASKLAIDMEGVEYKDLKQWQIPF